MKSFKLALFATVLLSCYTIKTTDKHSEKHLVIVSVNTKEIIDKSLRGQDIQKKINAEQVAVTAAFPSMEAAIKAKDATLAQQQNSYNESVKSLEAKSKMISDDARNKEIDELQKIRRQIEETTAERERLIRNFNEEAKRAEARLEQMYKKEMMAFEADIKVVIDALMVSEEWDFVLTREIAIAVSKRVDRTSIVINKLDEIETKRKETKQPEKKVETVKVSPKPIAKTA